MMPTETQENLKTVMMQQPKVQKNINENKKQNDERQLLNCNLCTFYCYSKLSLKRHMPIHANKNLYECPYCDYKHSYIYKFDTHLRSHMKTTVIKRAQVKEMLQTKLDMDERAGNTIPSLSPCDGDDVKRTASLQLSTNFPLDTSAIHNGECSTSKTEATRSYSKSASVDIGKKVSDASASNVLQSAVDIKAHPEKTVIRFKGMKYEVRNTPLESLKATGTQGVVKSSIMTNNAGPTDSNAIGKVVANKKVAVNKSSVKSQQSLLKSKNRILCPAKLILPKAPLSASSELSVAHPIANDRPKIKVRSLPSMMYGSSTRSENVVFASPQTPFAESSTEGNLQHRSDELMSHDIKKETLDKLDV